MRQIVNALFVRDGMVLLARRSAQRKSYPGLWSFPGGHAERGETMREALIRELREEVGVTPNEISFLVSIRDPNSASDDLATYHMYAVTDWAGGEPRLVGDEHTELKWLPFEAAADLRGLALAEYRLLLGRLQRVQEAASEQNDRRPYEDALTGCGVLKVLAPFNPRVAGTPPLGLDLPGSDIDVLCFAPDVRTFTDTVWHAFSDAPAFMVKQWVDPPRSVVASFEAAGWQIQLYGEAIPVEQQRGWRHFAIERRLLALGGHSFRAAVLALRQRGMKTEPAFASVLGLRGDPYVALLDLGEQDEQLLVSVLLAQGFANAVTA